jgi:hypothetical protein
MQPLDLCGILRDAVRSAGHLARDKNVEIAQEYDVSTLTVTGITGGCARCS